MDECNMLFAALQHRVFGGDLDSWGSTVDQAEFTGIYCARPENFVVPRRRCFARRRADDSV